RCRHGGGIASAASAPGHKARGGDGEGLDHGFAARQGSRIHRALHFRETDTVSVLQIRRLGIGDKKDSSMASLRIQVPSQGVRLGLPSSVHADATTAPASSGSRPSLRSSPGGGAVVAASTRTRSRPAPPSAPRAHAGRPRKEPPAVHGAAPTRRTAARILLRLDEDLVQKEVPQRPIENQRNRLRRSL
ncbi:MAG: hypothetical protein RLZZ341_1627, partial [Pseudomonadota bacterium]